MGMIPIDRSGGDKSQAALDAAEACSERGELFGIFPEGTRSRDGYLYKGRTGAARLAMKVGCPIYPVGIVGTDAIQPPDAKVPKLFKECSIKIGRPVGPSATATRARPPAMALDDRRGHVRDPRAHRTGVPQRVRRHA
jgi:1-acyl-sn-glycerol-3-phosphate acyltransferase